MNYTLRIAAAEVVAAAGSVPPATTQAAEQGGLQQSGRMSPAATLTLYSGAAGDI